MSEQKVPSVKNEIYMKDVFFKINSGFKHIKAKWRVLVIASILGGLVGLLFSLFQQTTYTAVCTFVLEDASGSGGLSQYASLAGLAGINLGGTGGGVFEGDNIIELYKSRTMIEKALLSEININGKKESLIERYINYNKLRDKWKGKKEDYNIKFGGDPEKFDRKQDSIITNLWDLFNKKVLIVTKPDKKLSIINVNVISNDELFAKEFTNKLVETVNKFYLETKTQKNYQNVKILQHQADSIKNILNLSINGVASANDAIPNANPLMSALKVPSQRKQIDVQATSAIYGEIIKNLELGKITLRQESPLIQVIDRPKLPLAVKTPSKLIFTIVGCFVFLLITTGFLFFKKYYSELTSS
jgi:uncharacterized protein involved in exopolysaccharide biosynthesis